MRKQLFFFFTLFVISCSKKQEQYPSWFLTPPENTPQEIYGVGAGSNQQTATQEALTNMKEKVFSSVSSRTISQDSSINGQYENDLSRTVKITTPQVDIQGYKIEKSQVLQNQHYVLLSMEKQKLAQSIYTVLEKSNAQIKPQMEEYQTTSNYIQKVKILKNLSQICQKHTQLEAFYSSLGYMTSQNYCTTVMQQEYNLKNSHSLQISNANPTVSQMLYNVFSQKFTINQNSNFVINYKTSEKSQNVAGVFMSGVEIEITDGNNAHVGYKKCIGQSKDSKEKASENALNNCLNQSKSASFEEFFSI